MTLRHILLTALLSVVATASLAQAPIVQPGAPGLPSRQITAEEAIALAGARYSAHDVQFMRDMIPHHQQALEMSALVAERTARSEMLELARRIESTQKDEIKYMENWLHERGERVPEAGDHEHGHAHHGGHRDTMHGMATAEQMADLAAASGEAFDTLFLELMIRHHEGALTMVDELVEKSGSVQDPALFEFTTHIKNDQKAEIERMMAMATDFSPDPRAGLAAGFLDAGEAALHMELLAALPKPDGFVDPENPAGLPSNRLRALARGDGDTEATDDESEGDETVDREDEREEQRDAESEEQADDTDKDRRPLLDFAHTDLAFSGNLLVAGNYHGFNIYDLSHDGMPELVSSVVCPGGQGDVSVVGNLLLLSVEQTRARLDCGLLGVADKISDERFRGLRIFDISDPTHPLQVGAVQTCRGSHTHTVVAGPGEDGKLIVYNSGTSSVRDEEELEGCSDKSPWRDEQTALFRIDVIEIPIDRPQDARVVDSPAVFADPETGILAGLWERGDHGPRTQTTSETNHCHDITVFPAKGIAAGACSGNGILFDISDPLHPKRIHEVVDPGFAYWHSATFSNDGTKVIFTDEWGGGVRPRCRASDPAHWGANAIYDIVDNRMIPRSHYKLPAPQSEQENCVAHNGSLIPVPGRDIMVQAWYQGGISVFDFTDSTNPFEIAFFDRGPIDAEVLVEGGYWSAYYYQGLVYGTEMARGLDVLALLPSEFLSEHEIAAARLAVVGDDFNPQQQFQVSWPQEPVVAHAYHDQLLREGSLEAVDSERLTRLLDRTDLVLRNGERDATLSADLMAAAEDLASRGRDAEGITRTRLLALSETLQGMASQMDAQS
ncbi:MAG: DUF305 domain-containing protein [Gammaproteobacteria bacterium]|nr:DUF305 domain-containing protein [Gammaproteobacteria bacterium]